MLRYKLIGENIKRALPDLAFWTFILGFIAWSIVSADPVQQVFMELVLQFFAATLVVIVLIFAPLFWLLWTLFEFVSERVERVL